MTLYIMGNCFTQPISENNLFNKHDISIYKGMPLNPYLHEHYINNNIEKKQCD